MRFGAERAFTVCLMPIDRPSVAITSGITPCRISGSTMTFLNADAQQQHRDDAREQEREPQRRAAREETRIENAGSITNSPCAKLMVPDACHSSVKPAPRSA
jgi:hypothetical protein